MAAVHNPVNWLKIALGIFQVVGECTFLLAMFVGVLLEMFGNDSLASQIVAVGVVSFLFVAAARLAACVFVLIDKRTSVANRIDECFRFLIFPGWRASRYLRSGRLEA
jgi:hypothetical protein